MKATSVPPGALVCPRPVPCGTRWHVRGGAAARACANRERFLAAPQVFGAPPAPADLVAVDELGAPPHDGQALVTWREAALERAHAEVEADLVAADDAVGWSNGCGRPHPSGGHGCWAVVVSCGVSSALDDPYRRIYPSTLTVEHYLGADPPAPGTAPPYRNLHRADAPAQVVRTLVETQGYDPCEVVGATVVSARVWHLEGAHHRGDGPVASGSRRTTQWAWRGRILGEHSQDATAARLDKLLSWGARESDVVGWLAHERDHGRSMTKKLLAAGVRDPDAASRARKAGALDARAVLAVEGRRAPASWAARS